MKTPTEKIRKSSLFLINKKQKQKNVEVIILILCIYHCRNMVCIQGKQRFIGEAAVSVARMHFKNTATDIKRLIGRKFKHPEVQKEIAQLAYQCVELPNGDVGIVLNYNDEPVTFSCEQIVAMILNKMQTIAAAANEGVNPAYCVLSCPGFYTDVQRRALLNSCKIAGMNCLRLLNEHTAIALAYGIYKSARNLFHESEPQHVMFIDMGHASYTVSVVAFVQGKLQVKSAAFDRFLGGRDFDYALGLDAAKNFQEKYNIDPLDDPKSRIKLLSACEKSKKNLSPHGVTATYLNIECLADDKDYHSQISLEHFEGLIAPLLDRLEGPIQRALKDAGIDKSQLVNVEIIGGGTRVASVKRKLSEILGLDKEAQNYGLSTTLNADESVARGCALQCAILSPLFKVKEFHISDRVHLPVRISWEDDAANDNIPMETADDDDVNMETAPSGGDNTMVIFGRTDDYPKTKRITFRRNKAFAIDAVYDESAKPYLPADYIMQIGKFTVTGLPALEKNAEVPRIRVNVQQDLNGLFSVSSSQLMQEIKEEEKEKQDETKTSEEGKEADAKNTEDKANEPKKKRFRKIELTIQAEVSGLSTKEIGTATEKELQMAQQDRIIEETFNKRNELESYVYEMRNQIYDKYNDFITSDEKNKLENQLNEVEEWLYTDEGFDSTKSVYQVKLDELRKITNPVEFRQAESTERGVATSELQSVLEEYKRMVNSADDAYSHWTPEEREKLKKTCTDAEAWLFDELAKQNELKPTQAPVLTSAAIRAKVVAVRAVALPIVTKPKPLPKVEVPKEEPKSPEKKDDAKESKEDKDSGDKMDLD
jgi:heat shock protein 4